MTRARPFSTLFLVFIAVTTLLPLVAFVIAALHRPGSLVTGLQWPAAPQWGNFARVFFEADFGRLMLNSLIIIAVVLPATLLFAFLAGYGFGVLRFRGRTLIYTLIILGLTLPVEMIIVPLYYDFQSVGLVGTYWPIILTEIGMFMPFGVFWMTAYFRGVPLEIIEAAEVDGASGWRILWSILLPGARPALTTLGVLTFVWSWNQFLLVLVLIQDPALRTAPSGLGFFVGEHSTDVPSLAAATTVVMLPPLIVYLIFQRQFITGTLAGALKG